MSSSDPSTTTKSEKAISKLSHEHTGIPNPMDINTGVPSSKAFEPLAANSSVTDFAKVATQYYDGWGCFALSDPVNGMVWVSCGVQSKPEKPEKP
jgi:hypothetical protein